MNFPTLYKRTSTGSIQMWKIFTVENVIHTEHGQVDGKIQLTSDTISEGKNVGKKSETTPVQQAEAEAASKWDKKKKTGHVEDIAKAREGKDDVVGGVVPMLAHKFSEHAEKIVYLAMIQPKLDGIRCISIIDRGVCTLWTRTRKPITGVPHIQRQLEESIPHDGIYILDGELYVHSFKNDFEKIVSIVRQVTPAEGHEVVEYHVYDRIMEDRFYDRYSSLRELLINDELKPKNKSVFLVETTSVGDEEAVRVWFNEFHSRGYEGAMVRNWESPYENKRSYHLQKVKIFDDAEFEIVGTKEGRGIMAGKAIFTCKADNGIEFDVKMEGSMDALSAYLTDESLWRGKKLTVQYQGKTGKNQLPRFPIGKRIRNDIDA